MPAPWLTVVIPTFNGERYLDEALASVVAQSDPDIEVIAVDDGSTDRTMALLESYLDRLSLRVVRRSVRNWVANVNHGLSLGRGRLACVLHQDDRWEPGRLRVVKSLMDRFPEVALMIHPSRYIDSVGRRLGQWRCPLPASTRPLASALVIERLLVQNFLAMPAPTFDRERALRSGGLDEALWYAADWDLWLRLAAAGPVLHQREPLACFRLHAESQTTTRTFDLVDLRRQLEIVLERHLACSRLDGSTRPAVERAARFSIETNVTLAAWAHGRNASLGALVRQFLALRPRGMGRYCRDSRIVERVTARLRMKVGR